MKDTIIDKKTADVKIDYQENFLDTTDLKKIEEILNEKELSLDARSHPGRIIGGIEDFFPEISVLFSPEVVNLMVSITGAFLYDIAKMVCKSIYNSLKKKPHYRMEPGKIKGQPVIQESKPVVYIIFGQLRAILPNELDNDKFNSVLDKFFENINATTVTQKKYIKYFKKSSELKIVTDEEFIKEIYKEKQMEDMEKESKKND